ncbi:hypothetical protein Nepgr_021985 [Nepenthes gracilis]|uniref:Uncharacterized protein n=1 Tax=Nepenthes gracilis TaxID=150966 RepID=A0AAD3XXL4_NEPGR|nr:hypothetical protein Nepgr_021985 [Nepenthes gracilis]
MKHRSTEQSSLALRSSCSCSLGSLSDESPSDFSGDIPSEFSGDTHSVISGDKTVRSKLQFLSLGVTYVTRQLPPVSAHFFLLFPLSLQLSLEALTEKF